MKKGTQEGGRERGREEGGRKGGREKQQILPAVDFPQVPLVIIIAGLKLGTKSRITFTCDLV